MPTELRIDPSGKGRVKKDEVVDSGPSVRRRVNRSRKSSNPQKPPCFNWLSVVTCLVTMEVVALSFLVLRSHTIQIDPLLKEDPFHFLVWLDTTLGGGGEQDREELEQLEAWLVQRTEDRLDHGYLLEHEHETVALDNYYQRPHIQVAEEEKPSVLLVAGVEGSGSRAVVDALLQMGIPTITLDPSQSQNDNDRKNFHTGQIAWREMINTVLRSGIHTSNYEFHSLSQFSQLRIKQEWEKLYQGYIAKQLPQTKQHHVILYAFQAHDALFMLPVFQALMLGPLKVIHVVRDGREVSLLSTKPKIGKDNKEHPMHSMAERFVMETFYGTSNATRSYDKKTNLTLKDQGIVQTMELWNDWNMDSLAWLEEHRRHHVLDYLQLRTEDLLSPEKKLEALMELSHFTGTAKTMPLEQLCCLSRQSMVVESTEYVKSFAKAKAQHEILKKHSAKLSFMHEEEEAEEERRKARLGDLIVGNNFFQKRRPAGPIIAGSPRMDGKDSTAHEIRQDRFRGIGDRLAARLSGNPAEGRRLMESRRMDAPVGDQDRGDPWQNGRGGRGRIQSLEVKSLFQQYYTWRKSLGQARTYREAAAAAIEKGEQLLAEYHRHQEHLKGVLTEDSFTRSIDWLKNLQADENGENPPPPPPGHISHRYGKWAQVLREQPQLAQRLNKVGDECLKYFGYEPHARFIDFDPENKKALCHAEVVCN